MPEIENVTLIYRADVSKKNSILKVEHEDRNHENPKEIKIKEGVTLLIRRMPEGGSSFTHMNLVYNESPTPSERSCEGEQVYVYGNLGSINTANLRFDLTVDDGMTGQMNFVGGSDIRDALTGVGPDLAVGLHGGGIYLLYNDSTKKMDDNKIVIIKKW